MHKGKRKISIIFFAIPLLLACEDIQGPQTTEDAELMGETLILSEGQELSSVGAQVTYFSPASGTYFPSRAVTSSLRFKNTGTERWTFWVGYSVQDAAAAWYDVASHSVTLDPKKESSTQSKTWYVPTDPLLTTGYYKIRMVIWKTRPENGGATRLASAERSNAFQAFNFEDRFSSWNESWWNKSPRGKYPKTNRGYIDPRNVSVSSGYLKIKFPANTFDGGQIESDNAYKYGTYRAFIKTAADLKSVTAFLLYAQNKDEITIEVFNDGSRKLWLTSWIREQRKNWIEYNLPFDPSASFHQYRIDYYPNFIDFYVDGTAIRGGTVKQPGGQPLPWSNNVPSSAVRIVLNAWFPTWPELPNPVRPTVDRFALTDWIKH